MIVLVTGLPGSGKTCYIITQLQDKVVYYANIEDVQITKWNEIDPFKWYECVDDESGTIILIDECHNVFPVRSSTKEAPPHVQRFDTHRHYGQTIYLVTQSPKDVDVFVRRRVERHYHLVRPFNGGASVLYTFAGCVDNPSSPSEQKNAEKTIIKHNKDTFGLYKSANIHFNKKRIPFGVYWIGILLVLLALLSYRAVYSVSSIGDTEISASDNSDVEKRPAEESSQTVVLSAISLEEFRTRVHTAMLNEQPMVPGMPWTAPVYADVSQPRTYPKPQCVELRNTPLGDSLCRCYSQQGTRLDVPRPLCRRIVKNGFFDRTLEDVTDDVIDDGNKARCVEVSGQWYCKGTK